MKKKREEFFFSFPFFGRRSFPCRCCSILSFAFLIFSCIRFTLGLVQNGVGEWNGGAWKKLKKTKERKTAAAVFPCSLFVSKLKRRPARGRANDLEQRRPDDDEEEEAEHDGPDVGARALLLLVFFFGFEGGREGRRRWLEQALKRRVFSLFFKRSFSGAARSRRSHFFFHLFFSPAPCSARARACGCSRRTCSTWRSGCAWRRPVVERKERETDEKKKRWKLSL